MRRRNFLLSMLAATAGVMSSKIAQSAPIDDAADYITATPDAFTDNGLGTDDFTMETWVKVSPKNEGGGGFYKSVIVVKSMGRIDTYNDGVRCDPNEHSAEINVAATYIDMCRQQNAGTDARDSILSKISSELRKLVPAQKIYGYDIIVSDLRVSTIARDAGRTMTPFNQLNI